QRSRSINSAKGTGPKFSTPEGVIVFYNSYVQIFLQELYKFISHCRGMIRKIVTAAESIRLEQLGEFEMPDENNEADFKSGSTTSIVQKDKGGRQGKWVPGLHSSNTGQVRPRMLMKAIRGHLAHAGSGTLSLDNSVDGYLPPDIWEDLDKSLDDV
ncbi:hypothetical protein B0T26DRAFT_654201, partial [Lasiosphaeria miniovina]